MHNYSTQYIFIKFMPTLVLYHQNLLEQCFSIPWNFVPLCLWIWLVDSNFSILQNLKLWCGCLLLKKKIMLLNQKQKISKGRIGTTKPNIFIGNLWNFKYNLAIKIILLHSAHEYIQASQDSDITKQLYSYLPHN